MAQAAVLRESCGRVTRIRRAVEIRQMTRHTRGREPVKHVVFMTLGTRRVFDMSARQGERGIVMVEYRALPIRR